MCATLVLVPAAKGMPFPACEDQPMQLANATHILGWGYQGRTPDDLLDDVQRWGIKVVVDVRLNPVSRKPGFSKRRLVERLEAAGVRYEHQHALGNPRDNRAGFADPRGAEGVAARRRFVDDVLASEKAQTALAEVIEHASSGSILLLCYEADERCCHRALILDALRERAASLPV